MRIQVLSDLHLEVVHEDPVVAAAVRGIDADGADPDVVVLAGDIAGGADGVTWAALRWPDRPVVYVLGNHEFYHRDVGRVIAECRERARGTNVHLLECEAVTIAGVRFLGTTLWTDFALFGNARAGERAAREFMMDFRAIPDPDTGILEPGRTREWHADNLAWLQAALAAGDAPTVVVSHHAPHRWSDHHGNTVSAGFVSDLSHLIHRVGPELWIHGHTHGRDDYRVGPTRVVSNQLGYPDESTGFQPDRTIELREPLPAAVRARA